MAAANLPSARSYVVAAEALLTADGDGALAEVVVMMRRWVAAAEAAGIVLDMAATLKQRASLDPRTLEALELAAVEVELETQATVVRTTTRRTVEPAQQQQPPPPPPHAATTLMQTGGATSHDAQQQHPGASAGNFTGRYQTGKLLGRGGVGEVRLITDRRLGRTVALKTLLRPQDASHRVRFLREARITGQLVHPNIVAVHDLDNDENDRPYFTMAFVEGRTLEQEIATWPTDRAPTPLELDERLGIFAKVCDAINFAHARGIIHRDLKPSNIMIGPFGEVLVMDWGLATYIGDNPNHEPPSSAEPQNAPHAPPPQPPADESHESPELTVDGMVLGTPAWMSPEQARGDNDDVDVRSDIYALGAILYNLLTLKPPFAGSSAVAVLREVRNGEFVPPCERVPHLKVSPALQAVVLQAMATEPEARFATVAELRHAMRGSVISDSLRDDLQIKREIPQLEVVVALGVIHTAKHLQTMMWRALEPFGFSPLTFNALRILTGSHPSALTIQELWNRCVGYDPDIVGTLRNLEETGDVEQVEETDDVTKSVWRVTQRGIERVKGVDDAVVARMREPWQHIDMPELHSIPPLMDRLRSELRPLIDALDPAPPFWHRSP